MFDYAAVVTLVHVVEPVVFTYNRVEVDEPSVRMYNDPCGAASVGAPEPPVIVIPATVTKIPEG